MSDPSRAAGVGAGSDYCCGIARRWAHSLRAFFLAHFATDSGGRAAFDGDAAIVAVNTEAAPACCLAARSGDLRGAGNSDVTVAIYAALVPIVPTATPPVAFRLPLPVMVILPVPNTP